MNKLSPIGPKVSVIVPVYNAKAYLQRCLESILVQTYPSFELIAINDGSTDGSLRILEKNAQADSRIKIIDQPNQGQGVARNKALSAATGEFVLFVDADDYIEPVTIEVALSRAIKDESDFVHFDWKLASRLRHRPKASNYYNIRNLWDSAVLNGAECDELMDTVSFFTVTSLYRKSFLDQNGIRFGEGYVYEDNPFYVLSANMAERVSLVHSPLYIVQPNPSSTTQTAKDSDRHYIGHIRAINESLDRLNVRSDATMTYFAKYHLQKFMDYFHTRVPTEYRRDYANAFVEAFSRVPFVLDSSIPTNRYLQLFIARRVFAQQKFNLFYTVIASRQRLVPGYRRRAASRRRAVMELKKSFNRIVRRKRPIIEEPRALNLDGAFVFYGFDHRYAGNSRFLYEEMTADSRFSADPIFYITDDKRVPDSARIDPSEKSLIRIALAKAAVVFLESWVPPRTPKHPDVIWIQLWHGTPFKKVLFDSHEGEIISLRNDHKIVKARDIQKWDFLLADSDTAVSKFTTAFLFPKDRILRTGYPRVKFLKDHSDNTEFRSDIRQRLGVPAHKKLLVYAPTWRDYNYGVADEQRDFNYLADFEELKSSIGSEFVVAYHAHDYMKQEVDRDELFVLDASEFEIQELILAADALLTDYSSVLFDALSIDLPTALYIRDASRFHASRGVYSDIEGAVSKLSIDNLDQLSSKVSLPPSAFVDPSVLAELTYSPEMDLLSFLDDLDLHYLKRDW